MTALGYESWTARQWFTRYPDLEKPLFMLRVYMNATYTPMGTRIDGNLVTIRAFEGPPVGPNHTRLFCELWLGSPRKSRKPLFPREQFYVGVPGHCAIDSIEAKELVMSLFCMKPGDIDDEFFEHYTPEQLAFVTEHGEELDYEKGRRYLDENGNLRKRRAGQ